ncbi:MAG: hypothetical protein H6722_14175 [Sandaracinus sp.]|nr:hypothetical protein [Sandaracinus sp.]
MSDLADLLASVSDDRDAVFAALATLDHVDLPRASAFALGLFPKRPLVAMRMLDWLMGLPEPSRPALREEWLRVHNNACYMAVFHGEPEERRAIVERALRVAPHNIAIYHNAACALCKLGDGDAATEAIRQGILRGYDDATIASIRADDDLALIRDTDAFRRVLGERGAKALPAWASGFTPAEYTQFREAVRTVLPDPDLSRFEEEAIASCRVAMLDGVALERVDHVFDLRELAASCRGKPAVEATSVVMCFFEQYFAEVVAEA